MEKKYLFLIPLAVPLFFGGKAAVNALINKRSGSNGHGIKDTESLTQDSAGDKIMESDLHSDELRDALHDKNITDQMNSPEIEEFSTAATSKKESQKKQSDDAKYFEGRKLMKGPKGGKYYLNDSGRKVYLKK